MDNHVNKCSEDQNFITKIKKKNFFNALNRDSDYAESTST